MTRLHIHVEGETEETFVHEVLRPHLVQSGYQTVTARLLGNARQRGRRGGARAWSGVRDEIVRHLRQDPGCLAALMVDYYGLPATSQRAWPGRHEASQLGYPENGLHVQEALSRDVGEALQDPRGRVRFLPLVQMHEFEALLFSDCERFAEAVGSPHLAPEFQRIRDEAGSPEEIDDSPDTAPSKRIEKLMPGYQKVFHGLLASVELSLETIRAECPHFDAWVGRLEDAVAG